MVDKRHALCSSIRSAKNWLDKAEGSFRDAKDIRGELDLLLAEAELQRLREKEGFRQKKRRHILAVAVACCFVAVSFGGLYLAKGQDTAKHIPALPQQQSSALPEKPAPNEVQRAEAPLQEKSLPPAKDHSSRSQEGGKTVKESPSAFNKSEVRQFVRTAGQTLRGK